MAETTTFTSLPVNPTPVIVAQDPSALTTQQILREIHSLKEVIFTRFEAMDKAIDLFQDNMTRVPTETMKAVTTLRELHEAKMGEISSTMGNLHSLEEERFTGVQKQFDLRDRGVKETADLTNLALQAALSAAEKAVQKQNESFSISINKSEAATTKQIDLQNEQVRALSAGLNDKLNDLKERLNTAEGRFSTAVGSAEGRSGGMGALWGWIVGAIGLVIAFVGMVTTIFLAIAHFSK